MCPSSQAGQRRAVHPWSCCRAGTPRSEARTMSRRALQRKRRLRPLARARCQCPHSRQKASARSLASQKASGHKKPRPSNEHQDATLTMQQPFYERLCCPRRRPYAADGSDISARSKRCSALAVRVPIVGLRDVGDAHLESWVGGPLARSKKRAASFCAHRDFCPARRASREELCGC